MPKFQVGAAVVHQDRPNQRGRIVEIRLEDPVEYQVRWSDTRVLGLVAESALLPADADDLDEQQLEDDAGSLD